MEAGDVTLIVFLGLCIVGAYVGQLMICLRAQRIITRLVPVIILVGIELVCMIIILVVGTGSEAAEGISLMALSQMVICAALLLPAELAWLTYGIKWFIEKKKNSAQVSSKNT